MPLTNVVSDVRQGKTLWITIVAINEYNYAVRKGYTPRPLFANYKINLPNWHPLKPETLFAINKKKYPKSLVLLDEAYAWIESRGSGSSNLNKYMSYILFQSGKRGIDFMLTDQIEGTIDTRYRQLLNFRVECENLGVGNGFIYYFTKRIRGGFTEPIRKFLNYNYAEKIFPFYDTNEIVEPMDEDLLFTVSQDKDAQLERVQEIIDEMTKDIPAGAWKTPMIEVYCLKHRIPKFMVKLIHGQIKTNMAEEIYNSNDKARLKRCESHEE